MSQLAQFTSFLLELLSKRHVVIELTKRDFRSKYLGSALGIFWAFFHPTVYITILWFVFQVGFKNGPVDKFPFILWLMTGLVPWFFFSDCLASAANSIQENSFLVKKVAFSMGMLPLIKILSGLVIHLFFVVILFLMFLYYGYPPTIYNLQIFYYLFASIMLLLGISWLTSSLILFLKDTGQVIAMVLQFAFWLTPIFWQPTSLPPEAAKLFKLNPVYYIVQGYRESFMCRYTFWDKHLLLTCYFWGLTLAFFFIGATVFRRLRPHFGDVL